MVCAKCKIKPGKIKTVHGLLCNSCFIRYIQKRIRKHLRTKRPLQRGIKVYAEPVSLQLLRSIYETDFFTFVNSQEAELVLEDFSLDDFIDLRLRVIIEKKDYAEPLSILSGITDNELLSYAKLKKISFRPRKKSELYNSLIIPFLEKHLDANFAMAKSFIEMDFIFEELIKKIKK
jgi:hypothetical protein